MGCICLDYFFIPFSIFFDCTQFYRTTKCTYTTVVNVLAWMHNNNSSKIGMPLQPPPPPPHIAYHLQTRVLSRAVGRKTEKITYVFCIICFVSISFHFYYVSPMKIYDVLLWCGRNKIKWNKNRIESISCVDVDWLWLMIRIVWPFRFHSNSFLPQFLIRSSTFHFIVLWCDMCVFQLCDYLEDPMIENPASQYNIISYPCPFQFFKPFSRNFNIEFWKLVHI